MRNYVIRRYLSAHPLIQGGRLVFKGTRIPVTTVLELLEHGMSVDEILRGFPSLTRKAIRAALQYARLRIENEEFIPIVSPK